MIEGLIDTVKVLVLASLGVAALAFVVLVAVLMYESATAEVPHIDEDYWLARGYDPRGGADDKAKKEEGHE